MCKTHKDRQHYLEDICRQQHCRCFHKVHWHLQEETRNLQLIILIHQWFKKLSFCRKKTLCHVKAFSSSLREFTKVSFFCNKCISAVALLYIVGIYDTSFFARYWSIIFRLQVRNKDEERRQAKLLSPFYLFIQG